MGLVKDGENAANTLIISARSKPRNALPLVNKALAIFQWKQDFQTAEKICREAIDIGASAASMPQLGPER